MRGDFKPGWQLKETGERVVNRRGPEALRNSKQDSIRVQAGHFVAWTSKEIEDFYIFRMHTEGLSAHLAAKRKTVDDEKVRPACTHHEMYLGT